MASLHIHFDSPIKFKEKDVYFSYKNIDFRCTSPSKDGQGVLHVITPGGLNLQSQRVADIAVEFLVILSFQFHQPFIFTGTSSAGYIHTLENILDVANPRNIAVACSVDFPVRIKKFSKKEIRVLSIYNSYLSFRVSYPYHAFLELHRVFEKRYNKDKVAGEIYDELGQDFFSTAWNFYPDLNFKNRDEVITYLTKTLRHHVAHGNKNRTKPFPDLFDYVRIKKINQKLGDKVKHWLDHNFKDNADLFYNDSGKPYPVFQTEEDVKRTLIV